MGHMTQSSHVDSTGVYAVQSLSIGEQSAAPEDVHGDGAAGQVADVLLKVLDDLAAGLGLVVNGGEVDGQGIALDGVSLGGLFLSRRLSCCFSSGTSSFSGSLGSLRSGGLSCLGSRSLSCLGSRSLGGSCGRGRSSIAAAGSHACDHHNGQQSSKKFLEFHLYPPQDKNVCWIVQCTEQPVWTTCPEHPAVWAGTGQCRGTGQ